MLLQWCENGCYRRKLVEQKEQLGKLCWLCKKYTYNVEEMVREQSLWWMTLRTSFIEYNSKWFGLKATLFGFALLVRKVLFVRCVADPLHTAIQMGEVVKLYPQLKLNMCADDIKIHVCDMNNEVWHAVPTGGNSSWIEVVCFFEWCSRTRRAKCSR